MKYKLAIISLYQELYQLNKPQYYLTDVIAKAKGKLFKTLDNAANKIGFS